MRPPPNRREFLADVGRGMLVTAVGYEMASNLGLVRAIADEVPDPLTFGALEPLVCLMQETPVDQLLPRLMESMRSGTGLRRLLAAAALANARTFGGEDYVGFHTMMALAPAYHMSQELPPELQPLPVFKVLYRNTNRIREHGGRTGEVLRQVTTTPPPDPGVTGETLRQAVRAKDLPAAEQRFAALAQGTVECAFNELLLTVQDETEVHRVVMPYRAWDLLSLIGREHAQTLLRQSVHYCIRAESSPQNPAKDSPRTLLPRLLEEYRLLDRKPGEKEIDDNGVDQLSQTIFNSSPSEAAAAVAAILAEGMAPAAVGEALTLAANQLILRDQGRTPRDEVAGKPVGSVHGDSIGVHASDSANAWRNMARVANARNAFASLILGAYQVSLDRTARGGDFLNWQPLPVRRHLDEIKGNDPEALLRETEEAIRGNLQAKTSALVHRYGEMGLPHRPLFDLLLKFAVSEDGSLHAEKFYRTASEEFATTRPAYRWRHAVALARVTASEFGRSAPGMVQARSLLKVG